MTIVTLLTDFGTADSYVAELKGVLLARAPAVTIVDISHQIAPGDIGVGQYLLGRAWKTFPQGTVHLAVVDPGVGTDARAIGAESGGHRFLGRDVFAPVAAALANGTWLAELGSPITDPYMSPLPSPRHDGTAVMGEVIYVDRFGTLVSNIPPSMVEPGVRIRVGDTDVGPLRRTFADVARGALVAFTGSGGTVEIAVRDGSAARLLGVGVGAHVRA
jgi:S-adenosylmethionine hydrolase